MPSNRELLDVLAGMRGRLDVDLSLEAVARRAGWSPFHLHRAFHRLVGETPKQYVLRLRLEQGAVRLASEDSITEVALGAGFGSHAAFSRAFRRRFGRTPSAYRAALRRQPVAARDRHAAVALATGPCIGLYHMPVHQFPGRFAMPTLSIERKSVDARPVLFMRRRVGRHEIAATIGQCLGAIFGHCQANGIAVTGPPFTRYPEMGQGLITMDCGLPIAAKALGSGDIEAGSLQGGAVAFGIHAGGYETLGESYTAIERWITEQGAHPGGPPWEVYVTDPAEHPDPKDWRTEIYWPLAE